MTPERERFEVRCAADGEPVMDPDPRRTPRGWERSAEGAVGRVAAERSLFFPDMRFRVLWDDACLYVRMTLRDRWVRSVVTAPQGPVHTDSCCEFFVRPAGAGGYFNFETNAGGCIHASYVTDPRRLPGGALAAETPVPAAWLDRLEIHHNLPRVVDPELASPTDWCVCYALPLELLEACAGVPCRPAPGAVWRANFQTCGDATSHPRYCFWSDLGPGEPNFHKPEMFGELLFTA